MEWERENAYTFPVLPRAYYFPSQVVAVCVSKQVLELYCCLSVADLQLQMNVSLLEVQCDSAVGLGAASPYGWARGGLRASSGVSLAE